MSKNLVIVESPAKAKTIEKFLGKDFVVKSCFGHVRDLEKAGMGINLEKNYTPSYIIPDDKLKVVNDLKKLSKSSDEVWLATDEDREGEAISWHLCEVLNLNPKVTKRIVFHEITKPAILEAVENPRTIDMNLVNAQQARRVLDRIVGFELSPVLWRKISVKNNLSAGRVQSVALRLIVDREREINQFQTSSSYKIEANFSALDVAGKQISFSAEGKKQNTLTEAEKFLNSTIGAKFTVKDIVVKPGKRSPAPPFTTSTLQQEASRKLGYGVSKTMLIAQKLYENGYITYMRTDSITLSNTALKDITNTVTNLFGKNFHQYKTYKNKNERAQEAHEAIRPTSMSRESIKEADWQKLYELIWKRTLACQMADAELEKTTAIIDISTNKEELTAQGEVIKFEGFLKVYIEDQDDEEENGGDKKLPNLKKGQSLDLNEMTATEKFARPPARYTEAALVKKMEELGIGRPSTYAPTISTILKRGYVEKRVKEGVWRNYQVCVLKNNKITKTTQKEITGADKGKLIPNDLGMVVTDFLKLHFDDVINYNFTAQIEEEFDDVADGKLKWNKLIDDFYLPFKRDVDTTIEKAERLVSERNLGIDPVSKKNVYARMGRFGPIVQIGDQNDEEKPRFAALQKDQSIETIELKDALELFKLPRIVGKLNGEEVMVNVGRFGPYIKFKETFISVPRDENLLNITLQRCQELIKIKLEGDAPIAKYDNLPVTKGKGRFGPFLKWNNIFINVPRRYDFDNLAKKDIDELIEAKIKKEENRYIQQWENEKISIENARWGAIIKYNKKIFKVPRNNKGEKFAEEELKNIPLATVQQWIEEQAPGTLKKMLNAKNAKPSATKKATVTKKKAATKTKSTKWKK